MKRVTEKNMIDYLVKIENKYNNFEENTEEFRLFLLASCLTIKQNNRYELFGSPYSFLKKLKRGQIGGISYSKPAKILLNDLNFFRQV